MVTTVNLTELQQLVSAELGDPHHILGLHEENQQGMDILVGRAFIPQAKELSLIDPADGSSYPMQRIHMDGFFEVTIPDKSTWFMYQLDVTGYNDEHWISYDAYSFQPVLTGLDRYLFGEGTHYDIYKKLGAHPMTLNGVDGVLFAVWAPNARRVSVIGDFNTWDGRRHQMRILQNSGIWELFIPMVQQYDKYKFEIKAQNGNILQKSDPYASYAELRPNTASVVYDIDGYEWADDQWMETRKAEDPLNKPLNIYEVHLGSWRRPDDGREFLTYDELAESLVAYVVEMGYTHIELLPVEEYPFDGSWGYQVTGYYAPTSRYGEPHDFMRFVDICHRNGIGVILDWVPAHFPKDAHGLAKFDGSALYEHSDPRQGEHPDWGTLIFNYGRKEVKNFLIANALFWLKEYHLDGLRVDAVASMLYLDYGKEEGQWIPNKYGGKENLDAIELLKHMNSIILGHAPHVLMIAEESTAWPGVSHPVQENGIGFNLKWNMGWMNDFLRYVSEDPLFKKYHHDDLTFSMIYAYTENFVLVLSHDEVVHGKGSLINKMPGDLWQKFAGLRASLAFMYGHPGKKLLFMGSEFGQFAEWSEAKSLDWFLLKYEHHQQMQDYSKALNLFYKNDMPMWYDDFNREGFTDGGGFEWIDGSDYTRSIVAFFRRGKDANDVTIFICNFTPVVYEQNRFGLPFEGKFKEVFSTDDPKYGGSGVLNTEVVTAEKVKWHDREYSMEVRVPPLAVSIWKPSK